MNSDHYRWGGEVPRKSCKTKGKGEEVKGREKERKREEKERKTRFRNRSRSCERPRGTTFTGKSGLGRFGGKRGKNFHIHPLLICKGRGEKKGE